LKVGWKPHHLFRGVTAGLAEMRCHVAVLEAGHRPHPPHEHEHEEILIVLDGTADLALQTSAGSPLTTPQRVERGAVAYYPAGFFHSISNPSDAPVTYLMFKWKSGHRANKEGALAHHLITSSASLQTINLTRANGFGTEQLLDGKSDWLCKLHAHATVVEPGRGYAKRWNAYDVAIVLLEGEVETGGERVKAPGVIFYCAGESHGIQNLGTTRAIYLVFEFHGKAAQAAVS
jgi:uncharacterized cupin superfamily protein